jgi:hypothetical protein
MGRSTTLSARHSGAAVQAPVPLSQPAIALAIKDVSVIRALYKDVCGEANYFARRR